ncbi:hypothetical protein [Chryseolinea lacunae]|uniref:Uncharacterized protein n=1 Tax=Chryseolinea lacunae TaxID=2801331 RepID=A0ABS1KRI0_9BACT|nr:hypothetical protein [Chryseolinea lacunae]MBL0741908.1 hypothetical protein [Chryseolinea lacunae]
MTYTMTLEHYLFLGEIEYFLSGVILLLSLLFSSRRSVEVKAIGFISFCGVLIGIVMHTLPLRGKEVNIPTLCYFIVNFLTIAILYFQAYGRRYGKILFSVAGFFTVFSIVNILYIQQMDINTYTSMAYASFVLTLAVVYFYRLLVTLPVEQVQQLPMFYFSAAFLFYGAGTFFLYAATNYLVKFFYEDVLIYYIFHNYVVVFQQLIFIRGLLVDLRNIRAKHEIKSAAHKLQ